MFTGPNKALLSNYLTLNILPNQHDIWDKHVYLVSFLHFFLCYPRLLYWFSLSKLLDFFPTHDGNSAIGSFKSLSHELSSYFNKTRSFSQKLLLLIVFLGYFEAYGNLCRLYTGKVLEKYINTSIHTKT